MTLIQTTAIAVALTLSTGLPSGAQGTGYDTDGDGVLSQDEFNAGFGARNTFGGFDGDADGMLNEQEFDAGFAGRESEFRDVNQPLSSFADFDGNGDGRLDQDEYNSGAFNRYDTDLSGRIEVPEAGRFESDMTKGGLFDN